MKIILSEAVITEAESEPWKINKIVGYICEGRHFLSFDPPEAQDRWLGTFEPSTRAHYSRALGLSARASATLPSNIATVYVKPSTITSRWSAQGAELSLDDALIVLDKALGILVENAGDDWAFLVGILRPSERERLLKAVRQNWAVPLHGGGSTLDPRLRERCSVPSDRVRTFVIFDSDRRHPNELHEDWQPTGPERCQGYNFQRTAEGNIPGQYWMLTRRSIESYVPVSSLPAGGQGISTNARDAFMRLRQRARWYFNMKLGFGGDAGNDRHRCLDLFADVSQEDRDALETGFGRRLARVFSESNAANFDWDADAIAEAGMATQNLLRLL